MSLAPGTKLGSYEIISLLGARGMGEVYRARDLLLAPLQRSIPQAPPQLHSIAGRCLANESGERYDSTRVLTREIKSIDHIHVEAPSEPAAGDAVQGNRPNST